jgi:hypothetical protein
MPWEDLSWDVRVSRRLADSPSCVVSDKDDPSLQVREMLKAMAKITCGVKPSWNQPGAFAREKSRRREDEARWPTSPCP